MDFEAIAEPMRSIHTTRSKKLTWVKAIKDDNGADVDADPDITMDVDSEMGLEPSRKDRLAYPQSWRDEVGPEGLEFAVAGRPYREWWGESAVLRSPATVLTHGLPR